MFGIKYRNYHSQKHLGITVDSRVIGNPSKEKYTVRIPGSSRTFDFSSLYGRQLYNERQLQYVFNIYDRRDPTSKINMNVIKQKLLNTYMANYQKEPLYDDAFPNFYFDAEIVNAPEFSERGGIGKMTVTFNAYPFMISREVEGHDIWDIFNFETDIAQDVAFEVSGRRTVTLWNTGAEVANPTIIASGNFQITLGGVTYTVNSGQTQSLDFELPTGENQLLLSGNGRIEFRWHKEVL